MRTSSISQWHKLNVIHCSVDDSYLKATPAPLQDNNTLVCVGRLCAQKGQLLLIQAVDQLVQEGLNIQLRLVGDGEMRLECASEIRRRGLESHVVITGWASGEQVRNEILGARAFVLTSFAEGLPVVLMESLAMERPALSTYIAGIPELVLPGENGWLVPAGSLEAMVVALREIMTTPPERLRELGRAGRRKVCDEHNANVEAKKLLALFMADQSSAKGKMAGTVDVNSLPKYETATR